VICSAGSLLLTLWLRVFFLPRQGVIVPRPTQVASFSLGGVFFPRRVECAPRCTRYKCLPCSRCFLPSCDAGASLRRDLSKRFTPLLVVTFCDCAPRIDSPPHRGLSPLFLEDSVFRTYCVARLPFNTSPPPNCIFFSTRSNRLPRAGV